MKNVIILGPPGSGKGTQAKKLAEKLNLTYFGTGDLIREEIEKKTKTGKIFESFLKKGELVPDNLVNQLIRDKISGYKDGPMVFDGFPRTLDQARIIDDVWPGEEFLVFNIQVSAESLMKRMEKRWICEKCDKIFIVENLDKQKTLPTGRQDCDVCGGKLIKRTDDNPKVLVERIKVYEKQTAPLIDFYQQKGILVNIDGEPPIPEVENEIWEAIEDKIGKD